MASATGEGEARLEELRVTGNSLSHGRRDGDDPKQDVQKREEQWRGQSVQPHDR